jgi:hypothetical protein
LFITLQVQNIDTKVAATVWFTLIGMTGAADVQDRWALLKMHLFCFHDQYPLLAEHNSVVTLVIRDLCDGRP